MIGVPSSGPRHHRDQPGQARPAGRVGDVDDPADEASIWSGTGRSGATPSDMREADVLQVDEVGRSAGLDTLNT